MDNNSQRQIIISIGRAFGSGGHEIGRRLADFYGIKLYDRELVDMLAAQLNKDPRQIEQMEEKVTGKLFPGLQKNAFSDHDRILMDKMSQSDRMFLIEKKIIQNLAETESFVIVGRAANAILEGYPNTLRLYIYASDEFRIERIRRIYNLDSDQKAKKMMEDTDRSRREYFQYYTDMIWASSDGHDASVKSSSFGLDQTLEIIKEMVHYKLGV